MPFIFLFLLTSLLHKHNSIYLFVLANLPTPSTILRSAPLTITVTVSTSRNFFKFIFSTLHTVLLVRLLQNLIKNIIHIPLFFNGRIRIRVCKVLIRIVKKTRIRIQNTGHKMINLLPLGTVFLVLLPVHEFHTIGVEQADSHHYVENLNNNNNNTLFKLHPYKNSTKIKTMCILT